MIIALLMLKDMFTGRVAVRDGVHMHVSNTAEKENCACVYLNLVQYVLFTFTVCYLFEYCVQSHKPSGA